jgi:hypothetical protein
MRAAITRLAAEAVLAMGVAGACGSPISLGQPENDETVVAAAGECEEAPCGEKCTTSLGIPGWCDGLGLCGLQVACGSPWPCAGRACGEPCSPCEGGEEPCDEPPELHVCDMVGECVAADSAYCDPCLDVAVGLAKACGTPCEPCQPWDAECPPKASMYFCSTFGTCALPEEIASCSASFSPCPETASCGDPCTLCDEGDGDCEPTPGLFCTGPFGACVDQIFECPQDDCIDSNLSCGALCHPCPPEEPGCQPLFCDAGGACVPADAVTCGPPPCGPGSCGAPCQLCDPAGSSCDQQVFLFCDDLYGCTDNPTPVCGGIYQPCAGKVCGELCSDECDPYDMTNCAPTVVGTCDPSGACAEIAEPCR